MTKAATVGGSLRYSVPQSGFEPVARVPLHLTEDMTLGDVLSAERS